MILQHTEPKLTFEATDEFDEGDDEEAEEEGDDYGFDLVSGFDGANGFNGRGGGFGLLLGGGLGGLVVEGGGGAVARDHLLAVAVGGEADGVSVIVGLDGDGGDFPDGVVECESNGLYHGVVDGFIVGLMRDGTAASATHCKQGKHHYEGSR